MRAGQWLAWMGGNREDGRSRPAAAAGDGPPGGTVRRIRLADIRPNPFQPRVEFDEGSLAELAESIRRVGLLQPLLVRPVPGGGYELVAGERRWRAARLAGLDEVPALVRPMGDQDAAVLALVENLQREDLGFFEEAAAYQDLLQRFGLTQEQLAAMLGRQQSTVANKLRLLRLPVGLRQRIVAAGMSERHARALLRLPTPEEQERLLELAIAGQWSVRQLEEEVQRALAAGRAEPPVRRRKRRLQGLRAIKDVRILLNTVRAGVETLRRAGLAAEVEQSEQAEWIEVRIRIPKAAPVRGGPGGAGRSGAAAGSGGASGAPGREP
ncbi:ParB/RepB/Spo0J family partition protein [Thermaerobacter subterraneus]|uniref:ParB-like partition protein n=1 Tax=Thermaerobacter subterraneus DSM 13965 TaxID=867903 RepID=K6PPC7_9FIRM|nr:ParB/RepB/Spo0J family partition protein [Thermaerobacter subterraneus]EKP94772.1 ParB-like partition protein [Thermaerobacter subterraneus DSM 13965]